MEKTSHSPPTGRRDKASENGIWRPIQVWGLNVRPHISAVGTTSVADCEWYVKGQQDFSFLGKVRKGVISKEPQRHCVDEIKTTALSSSCHPWICSLAESSTCISVPLSTSLNLFIHSFSPQYVSSTTIRVRKEKINLALMECTFCGDHTAPNSK